MNPQHHKICKNLALTCIIGVLLSSALANSSKPKLQKLGLAGLGASLMAGVGIAGTLPRDDEDTDSKREDVGAEIKRQRSQQSR